MLPALQTHIIRKLLNLYDATGLAGYELTKLFMRKGKNHAYRLLLFLKLYIRAVYMTEKTSHILRPKPPVEVSIHSLG